MIKDNDAEWLTISCKILVISSTIYFFSFITADPDLWGHILFGKDMMAAGKLVRYDPYSFTAYNQPWINHEWLTELIFYWVYRLGGDAGLLFGKLTIGLGLAACLSMVCRNREHLQIVYIVIMVLAIFVISPGFMIRPQIFSFLFFTLFLYLLHLFFIQKRNFLFLLPFIMLFWVNLHGGFLIGLAILGAVVFWQTGVWFFSDRKTTQLKTLWTWSFVTSFAVLANPYGYNLLVFLYNSLSVHRDITEWQPIVWGDLSFLRFKIMACLFILTFVFNIKKSNGWEICAISMTLFAALRHQRHSPFFAIICTPYLVHHISLFILSIKKKPLLSKTARNTLAILIILLAGYQFYTTASKYTKAQCRIIVNPSEYPISAVQFLSMNSISGNLILPFNWGEYAIWKLYPDCRVSIDGRFRTVYSESVIQAHLSRPDNIEKWKLLINSYPGDILLARQSPVWQKFIKNKNEWVYVYSDKTAIIFLRRNSKNQTHLKRFYAKEFQYPKTHLSVYFP